MAANTARLYDLYQGRDWTSFRFSVAQAFETLDQMQDCCPPMAAPQEDDIDNCLEALRELADGLSGEIDALLADILPAAYHNPALRWSSVEVRHHLDSLRKLMVETTTTGTSFARQEAGLFEAASLIGKIKDLIRKIDQA